MGLYDTFYSKDESVEIQVKAGPCLLDTYHTGDKVHHSYMANCVIHGSGGGSVLIRNHVVIAVTDQNLDISDVHHLDKWGNVYSTPTATAHEAAQNDLYTKWADKLVSVLTDAEFLEFAEFMDSCDDVAFSGYLADRAAKIAPEQYINDSDLAEDTKRKVEV